MLLGGMGSVCTCSDARFEEALPLCLLCACRIHIYTHRRMAIEAEDVCLEKVIPITEGFAVEEGTNTLGWLSNPLQRRVWSP